MIATTHVAFGVLFAEFVFTCTDAHPSAGALLAAGIGSLMPDIDTPKSTLGRLVPVSALIEQRIGHRQLTHSALFVALCAIAALPVGLCSWWSVYAGFLLGVTSHLLIDMANPSGVPLCYPAPGRFVFPEPKDARIEVGSMRERVVLGVLLALVGAVTPVSVIGYKSLFYRLSQNPYWAIEEAKRLVSERELTMDVRGLWTASQTPVTSPFRLLAVQEDGFIALQGRRVYFLSHRPATAVLIRKLKLIPGRKLTKRSSTLRIDDRLFDEVALPVDAIASGYLFFEGFEALTEVLDDFSEPEYRTLRIDSRLGHKLLVSYCPTVVLERLKGAGLFISHGELAVTEFVPVP